MIERLSIKNFAVIDSLELEFGKGFTVFSGETGAGKSIVVGAISLLLGEKSDPDVIRSGADRAVVEAEFSIIEKEAIEQIKNLGIEEVSPLLIRREISQSGKNRVFINGMQEPVSKLEEISEWLADIHGQHDHQQLLNQKSHLNILDNYGSLTLKRQDFARLLERLNNKILEKAELEQDEKKLQEEKIFWETAIQEIDKADLKPGEEQELSDSIKRMENSEKIHTNLQMAYNVLYEDEYSTAGGISKAVLFIRDIAGFDKRYDELLTILEDASTKISESADITAGYKNDIEFDKVSLEEFIDRSELIKDLKRKFKKSSIDELLSYSVECREKISRFENRADELVKIKAEIESLKENVSAKAIELSKERQALALELSSEVRNELSFLGMDKAEFIIDIKYVRDESSPIIINNLPIKITDSGMDRVELFISTNPGEEPRPLRKAASGGEISRVMLALKAIISKTDAIDTLIFDEIDTGIGGLTANNIAQKMKDISRAKQLIVITHLPQIASKADVHMYISKEIRNEKTFTKVELINDERRIVEIARMLGGESETSRLHAREMLGL